MSKLIKWLAIIVLGVIIVFIAAAIILANTVNPNNYKPQIIAAVNKATGRSLSLPGNLSWSFFPNLGVHIGEASLSNPAGYAQPIFASVKSADVSIAIIPLLSGQIQANTLELNGLQLNLVKKNEAENNWTFASSQNNASSPALNSATPSSSSGFALVPIVTNLNIANGTINYIDQTAGAHYALSQVNFKGRHIQLASPFGVSLSFMLTGNQPQITASVSAKAKLFVDWRKQLYELDSIHANSHVLIQSKNNQSYKINANITGSAQLDLNQDTLSASSSIDLNNIMQADMSVGIKQLSSVMNYSGSIKIDRFDLGKLMANIGLTVPTLPNPDALSNVSLQGQFTGNKQGLSLPSLVLTENQSTLKGQFSLSNFKAPITNAILNVDRMDMSDFIGMNGARLVLQNINLHIQAHCQGWSPALFPATLSGQVLGNIGQITLYGIDVNAEFNNLNNAINNPNQAVNIETEIKNLQDAYSSKWRINPNNGKTTPLGQVNLLANIKNGIVKTNQLSLFGPSIQVKGSGEVNLNNQYLNFLFYINQPAMKPSLTIPYRVQGRFSNPTNGIDWVLFQVKLQKYLVQLLGSETKAAVQGTVNNLLNQLVNSIQQN